MTKILPFHPADADLLELREIDARALRHLPDPAGMIRQMASLGPFFTMLAAEGIVAIAGVVLVHIGMGEAWVGTSDLVEKYPLSFCRMVKKYLGQIIDDHGLWRVQSHVLAEHDRSHVWTRWLGLEQEGLMRKYGLGGEDYIRYAWVKED